MALEVSYGTNISSGKNNSILLRGICSIVITHIEISISILVVAVINS